MVRLIAQACVWNSAQFIAAPILAVHEYVDEIQVFDGAYEWMHKAGYADVPWSTDGTEGVVKSLKLSCPLKWIRCEKFYTRLEKWNTLLFKHLRTGEWRYMIADDEIPIGNLKQAFNRIRKEKKALIGNVPFFEIREKTMKKWHVHHRFFKRPTGFHFIGGKPFLGKKRAQVDRWPSIILEEMAIIHLKYLRCPKRLKPQLEFEESRGRRYGHWYDRPYVKRLLRGK